MTTRALLLVLVSSLLLFAPAAAGASPTPLPFTQSWLDTAAIAVDDDWSGVPGVVGYRGDGLTASDGVDPQTVLADGATTPVDVVANRTNPAAVFAGGVAEFELSDPVVALRGSVTADAPHLLLTLDTSGYEAVRVAYLLRDLDATDADAVQSFALQYRVGGSGEYVNVSDGNVPDATAGPGDASSVTPVEATLPAEASNRPLVELRVLTTNAPGADEWVGVDDIAVEGTPIAPPDTTPPTLSLGAGSPQSLGRALRDGVRARATLGEAASLAVTLRVSRWLAARLELPRVIGRATSTYVGGTSRIVVSVDRAARRRLATRDRIRLGLVGVARDGAGNASRRRTTIVLAR